MKSPGCSTSGDLPAILARGVRRLAERAALFGQTAADSRECAGISSESSYIGLAESRDIDVYGPLVNSRETAEIGGSS